MNFTIDIVSDVVCPWCYVGKRRLESAIKALPSDNFDINLLPFQLNPDVVDESMKREEYLASKFGTMERVLDSQNQLESVASQEGIKMDFSKIEFVHNTLNAHALMQSVESKKEKLQLNEAFLSAYFEHGKKIGTSEVLEQIANDLNIEFDPNYASPLNLEAVRQEQIRVKQMGITSVPSFIINGKYLVQGGQPKEQFMQMFEQIRKEIEKEL